MAFKQFVGILTLAMAGLGIAHAEVDPLIPTYHTTSGVAGNLSSVGSDTLANLVSLWAEAFRHEYPGVNVQVQAAGSSTAPPALTAGTANLGPMSRKMRDVELQAFEQKYGYKPTAVAVAMDALAVFVHKDNPIQGLTLAQVDAIFSSTRLCGAPAPVRTWGELGVGAGLAGTPLQLYGRNSVSGTYGFFKEQALCKGDFKANVNEQPGSASVVQAVSSSLNGIGYSGIGYRTAGVRSVPLARDAGGPYVEDSEANALNGRYPLARYMYVYVNKAPDRALAPLEAEFIKLVLSQAGQQIVSKDGYIPLPAGAIEHSLAELGLSPQGSPAAH
ncbi:phosphate ABC transporter substrate-binding protein PstS family protein [Pseudomonas typographi]|uniref:Phosphate-binding protein n=1 Tax=Pseudomonas typographi TaxID=2715964 RepID=A0ABR7Z2H4_9PSED|nr:phosphate ABC transporter substrate-binding protein PstS family protein [Pseudomonas typographi]MBD1585983.1 phosphate ABC transporter substrate-binding protein PstS family protein [Pseudomonas typographi]MBD1599652.1 phosphate ABC transporter substrate-binding protein PstS family protein [Pseudomonas typographi]